jgi:hypothetical protein
LGITCLRWIKMLESVPLVDWLIINDDVRFWQKANETICDAQFISGRTGIVSAARTPQVKRYAISFEPLHLSDNSGHGYPFRSY